MQRILIVDDDEMFRTMLNLLFVNAGYEVVLAENGAQALKRQGENPASVVITDIIMPEMEGMQTISEFRKSWPQTKIIAVSGGGRINSGQYLQMAKGLGAVISFAKPFKTSELLAAVKELLKE